MKKIKRLFCVVLFTTLLINSMTAFAQNDISSDFEVYQDTQSIIDKAMEDKIIDDNFLAQFNTLFDDSNDFTSAEYNELLVDSIAVTREHKNANKQKLQVALEEAESVEQNSPQRRTPIDAAKNAYNIGIALVSSRGCPMTGAYMIWARDKNGQTCFSINDDWAESCLVQDFRNTVTVQFEEEILMTGKDYGVVDGSFEFTTDNSDLDHYVALHNVDYAVTFTKSGAGYKAVYQFYDVYDFKWDTFDSIEVEFGNNYCYAMQQLGLIKPFDIYISMTY